MDGHNDVTEQSNPSSPSDQEIPHLSKQDQIEVLNACRVQIHDLLNFETIFPHLVQANLFTRSEQELLQSCNTSLSDDNKISKLVELLPKKGSDAIKRFVTCLWDTKDGTGHAELADFIFGNVTSTCNNTRIHEDATTRQRWPYYLLLIVALVCVCGFGFYYWVYPAVKCQMNSLSISSTLPNRLNNFVGRENDTQLLLKYLRFHDKSNNTKLVNIIGSPGFGKSTLAVEVGYILTDERTIVYYVNMAEFPTLQVKQVLADKVLSATPTSVPHTQSPTFNQLVYWARQLTCYTILILDNCDENIHLQKEEFYDVIGTLLQYSHHLKILITSREETIYLRDFRTLKIQPLTTKAACELLESKFPSGLSETEKREIAELTGNVPLALTIIGSLLHMESPPTPDEIISELQRNPIRLLTPPALQYKQTLNASISLSYQYLGQVTRKHARYMANFPGSFHIEAIMGVLGHISNDPLRTTKEYFSTSLKKLVSLSLLDHTKRSAADHYNFHRLIREFFLGVQSSVDGIQEKRRFILAFQKHYSDKLHSMTTKFKHYRDPREALTWLEKERHNVQHLLTLSTSPVNISHESYFQVISAIADANAVGYLKCRFGTEELIRPFRSITNILESNTVFTNTDQAIVFIKYVIALSDLEKVLTEISTAFTTLQRRIYILEDLENRLSHDAQEFDRLYMYFYKKLLDFKDHLNDSSNSLYNARILSKIEEWKTRMHCSPSSCQYIDIGLAYYWIKEYNNSIEFLEKALNETNLVLNQRLKAMILLYESYVSVKNEEGVQHTLQELVDYTPEIMDVLIGQAFILEDILGGDLEALIQILSRHGWTDLVSAIQEEQIKKLQEIGFKGHIPNIQYANRLARRVYQQSDYSTAVEIATMATEAMEPLHEHLKNEWDMIVIKLELQLIIGKGKYYSGITSVQNEGLSVLAQVADFIIERKGTNIFTSEFLQTCWYIGFHFNMRYSYSCLSSILHQCSQAVKAIIVYGILSFPFEIQWHAQTKQEPESEPSGSDISLATDNLPGRENTFHTSTKSRTALIKYTDHDSEMFSTDTTPPKEPSWFSYLVMKAFEFFSQITLLRIVTVILSVWIRIVIAYYILKCFFCCTCASCCYRCFTLIVVNTILDMEFVIVVCIINNDVLFQYLQ